MTYDSQRNTQHRLQRTRTPGYLHHGPDNGKSDVVIDCGWGRLLLSHTFSSPSALAQALLQEGEDKRDIALYVRDPHKVLAKAPQQLFLDPSDTLRLWLSDYRPKATPIGGIRIRRAQDKADASAINRLYRQHGLKVIPDTLPAEARLSQGHLLLLAEDASDGTVIGTVTGLNYRELADDPDRGSSLWCLAVDRDAARPGVGEALVRFLAEKFQAKGAAFMDLSVMHDNSAAIGLYESLGFRPLQSFAIKTRSAFNQKLFMGPQDFSGLNPYARIIVDEAVARGIDVTVTDAAKGLFTLHHGGKDVQCFESLTSQTHALAMLRCQDKSLTHQCLRRAGLKTPPYRLSDGSQADKAFLHQQQRIVVKPLDGEQGKGISIDVRQGDELEAAIALAKHHGDQVLLEALMPGNDVRILVIGNKVVAAARREPPFVVGDGRLSIGELIAKQSRRREAATGGESRIPVDDETIRTLKAQKVDLDTVLEAGKSLAVRRTANLHTGGRLVDVTGQLHPHLVDVALKAAKALDIAVVGMDLLVPDVTQSEYVIIEANERAGLANHEPHPTAQRFIDHLFPLSCQYKEP